MKRWMKHLSTITAVMALATVTGLPVAQADTYPTASADNTRTNQGDQQTAAATADHAKQDVTDRDLMSQIRKSVVGDHDLSTYAHNVKIVARHGVVTLKGPVKTTEEKQLILSKAVAVAGADNVKDQMTVKEESN